MEYFKQIFEKIIKTIIIQPTDSEILKAKKIIWYSIGASIIILLLVSWLIFILFTFNQDCVKVPMVEGDNIYVALKKLYKKNLVAEVTPRYSETIKIRTAYNQSPNPGTNVKKGRVVSFYVSLGERDLALPDFRGFNLFELSDFLEDKYPTGKVPFEIENLTYEFNEQVEKGRIFKQTPPDGTPVYNVKKVKLWVSNGIKEKDVNVLQNYIGRDIEEVSEELAVLEIPYTYDYEIIPKRRDDMIITDQSYGEGKLINEIIEEGKALVFKVNKYQYINGEKIKGTYLLDLPKKPLPFLLEVKLTKGNSTEKTVLKKYTKGGISIPIAYAGKKNSKLMVYIDQELTNEIELLLEETE